MEFRQVLAVKFVHRVTLVGIDRFRGFIQDLRDANRAEPVAEQHANPKLLAGERGVFYACERRVLKTAAELRE